MLHEGVPCRAAWVVMARRVIWYDVLVALMLLYTLLGLPIFESASMTVLSAVTLAWPDLRQKVSVFLVGLFFIHYVVRGVGQQAIGYLLRS